MKKICLLFLLISASYFANTQTTLVSYNSTWKYLDNGTNQGTAWRAVSFNDASWASGNAQLGYGDGDEATIVSYGSNANKKYITTYFRKTITVADASVFGSFTLSVKRDDGAVVYINGTERFRTNMPTGTISYTTKASTDAADDGNTAQNITLPSGTLVTGTNVIAVEVHQRAANSTDLSFDLQLTGAGDAVAPTVTVYSPADNATNVSNTTNLVLSFSENIQKGTGNILIKEGGVTTQTIDVTSAAVTVSGNTATINPGDFTYSAAVNIEIAAGAFKDLFNNNYAGIANATTWNFTVQSAPVSGPQTLIAYGSSWKYLDNGTNQGTAWRGTGFSDVTWVSGNAQLGYGDGDEATIVSYGSNASAKYITTYFRKIISVTNPSSFTSVLGNVKRDDGVAIYVNGTEVYRNNLAAGATYTTLATLASDDGATPQSFNFSPSLLVSGNNIIAVEIHQNSASSSDISFDLELIGNDGITLTRGPYMNIALQNSIVIRWKTDVATDSKVSYGTSAGSLTQSFTDNTVTTEHIVTLTGLSENTLYYYSIGSSTQTLQGDANNYFKTMPAAGSTQKIRVLAMGDMGDNSANQLAVRNAYLNFNGTNYTDAWLLLGDNAYENGLDNEYQTNFFNMYQGNLTKNHVLWPSPGNHDYANSSARQADHNIPYYSIFSLPANGQAGGVASNTEAFYSYNYGNIHFVSLDSYGWETGNTRLYDTLGPQMTWLKQDLAANTQQWTVIYFHHPPYTKTSHNSDTETELINMRQRVVRIFERYGVDMVLSGHSHGYERSFLINGHYDLESTYNPATHALSTSSAKYDGTANSCTYFKNSTDTRNGIVFVVAGSAGQLDGTSSGYPHNAMYYSDVSVGGAFFFEVEQNRLNAKWICADGVIRDQFTIMKNVSTTSNINIPSGTPTQLTASWIGNYSWSTGETTRTITVSPTANTTYTVNDGVSCLNDVFNITITGGLRNKNTETTAETAADNHFRIIPTAVRRGQQVYVQAPTAEKMTATVTDASGRVMQTYQFSQSLYIPTDKLGAGVYFIRLSGKNKTITQKILVTK